MRERLRSSGRLRSWMHACVAASALAGLLGCGARSSTIAEDELPDCTEENQKVYDECQRSCGVAQSAPREARRVRTGSTSPGLVSTDVAMTPCVESCLTEKQRACESTASCRCAQSLTAISGQ